MTRCGFRWNPARKDDMCIEIDVFLEITITANELSIAILQYVIGMMN